MTSEEYATTPDPVLLAIYRTARNTMEREDILALLDEVVERWRLMKVEKLVNRTPEREK